jgi:predicted glutamine amidotransferase
VAQKFAHPFIEERDGVTWAFQHNGSLVGDASAPTSDKIDSQILFDVILNSLGGRTHEDVAKATANARRVAIDNYGGFTSLNFMLSDGQALHVYRDFQTNGQYYTLYMDNLGEMIVGASEPILAMRAEPIPRGLLNSVTPDLEIQRSTIS